jgi:hypothetical protein
MWLDSNDLDWLRAEAERRGVPYVELVREAVADLRRRAKRRVKSG